MTIIEGAAGAADLGQDIGCGCGPDEGPWIFVVAVDVVADSHDQLLQISKDSAPNALLGQIAEETFNHVQPGGRGRREMRMKALMFAEPTPDFRVLVGGIVVADDVDLFFRVYGLIDQAQELQPLLMAMPLLAQAVDLAGGGVQSGKQRGGAIALIVVVMVWPRPFFIGSPGWVRSSA